MARATVSLPKAVPDGLELSGTYLTFTLGAEEFGLQILKVREMIRVSRPRIISELSDRLCFAGVVVNHFVSR
ncbi:MAG: hypothetical protein GXY41_07590 [Phycisphaerae bacterium]|nr:hypothetical protein [Phycisphaerae bacterium]